MGFERFTPPVLSRSWILSSSANWSHSVGPKLVKSKTTTTVLITRKHSSQMSGEYGIPTLSSIWSANLVKRPLIWSPLDYCAAMTHESLWTIVLDSAVPTNHEWRTNAFRYLFPKFLMSKKKPVRGQGRELQLTTLKLVGVSNGLYTGDISQEWNVL
jgi:hypothetical protein